MSDSFNEPNQPADEAAVPSELEQIIFAARDLVVPSDDLRPRVVEQAAEESSLRRWAARVAALALATMVLWSCLLPIGRSLSSLREHITAPTTAEVEEMAYLRSVAEPREAEWGLVDVFFQIRSLKASEQIK